MPLQPTQPAVNPYTVVPQNSDALLASTTVAPAAPFVPIAPVAPETLPVQQINPLQ